MATAISIPTAPVVPAIRHIFLASGSMGGVAVSRRGLEIKADRAVGLRLARRLERRRGREMTGRDFRIQSAAVRRAFSMDGYERAPGFSRAAAACAWVVVAALSSCAHFPRVRRVAKGEPKLANVIYYALPRTVVTVQATARREETEAGRCSSDLAWLTARFGPKAQPMRYGLRYEIGGWRIATRPEPDPDAVFAISVSADTFDDRNQAIELSPPGVLLLDGTETTGIVPQFVSAAVQLGGSLVAKAVPLVGLLPSADSKEFTERFCKEVKKRIEEMDAAETKLVAD